MSQRVFLALVGAALSANPLPALAQSVSDYSVRVSAVVQTNPPQIALSWPADPNATGYTVYRKSRDDTAWGTGTTLAGTATTYLDSGVLVGSAYEYRLKKSASTHSGEGYIYAGIEVPLVESRGKIILLVDDTQAAGLAPELARLQQDLVGDGWTALRHDVPRMAVDPANTSSSVWAARSNELAAVKAIITNDYYADPANVKALLLFGRVPVPYSGNLNPDGHANHLGAWPADSFYGDVDGAWADTDVTSTDATDPRNRNVPGDGKCDRNRPAPVVELQVGRVDLANLPAFSQSETELLRRYLNKDHRFKHKLITAERRGLIDDGFGLTTSEPLAACGWRNFAPMFGADNTIAADWLTTLATQSYLWGYGCGAGTYASCSGVATTSELTVSDPRVVFAMLFGSYFGDWDSLNNLLRATIATPNYTLTSVWANRPDWQFHHMALGETVGFSARVNHNNTVYNQFYARFVHVALMGDPTLRMHVVAPPSALLLVTNDFGGVDLSWDPSPDTVLGYHVYAAPAAAGPFTRLTTNLLTGTSFTDPAATSNVYMVRAVKLEETPSGSYYNPSQGIFQSPDGTAGAPWIELFEPTNNAAFGVLPAIKLSASLLDPANAVTNVVFFANETPIGSASGPFCTVVWANVPGGAYSLTARAYSSLGLQINSAPVTVTVAGGAAPRLTITPAANDSNLITGDDALGRTHRIQFVTGLGLTNWQTLGTATGEPSGFFHFLDSATAPRRFYRSVTP